MKLIIKHDTSNATQIAEPILADDLPFIEGVFESVTEITISHTYLRICQVILVNPAFHKIPETRIKSIQFLEGSVHVVFLARESGTYHVSP